LERKNAAYAQLIAEKNELLGIAAHDIRSPLTVIEMYSSVLSESSTTLGDAKSRKFIEIIRRVTRRALDMVSNVLDITAIESGKLRLDARPLDLRTLIRESLEAHSVLARSKGIEIEFACDEDVPPVSADPLRFEQVLSNLLSNAVKFSTPGHRVIVRLYCRNGDVGLAVQDEGRGIPPEILQRLFVPFSARGEPGTSGEKSTGLGLAIVHKIASSHGGSVEVDSEVGKGTTFTVLFPR
jgi:signal transduction histidine kinase